jgi:hypothetical protein
VVVPFTKEAFVKNVFCVLRIFLIVCGVFNLTARATPPAFPSDEQIRQTLRQKLKNQGDSLKRNFRRLGNKTIELESYAALEGDFSLAPAILSDVDHYDWALEKINERSDGSKYFIRFLSLVVDKHLPQMLVSCSFGVDLPMMHYKGKRQFKVTVTNQPEVYTIRADTVAQENTVINTAAVILKVFPAEGQPGHLWIYINGHMEVGPWLLYEALPERVMNRQSAERISTLLESYQREEERVRQLNAKSNLVPTGKTAPPSVLKRDAPELPLPVLSPQKPDASNPIPD